MTQPARVDAPAKLTLFLRVTGVRADGYHLLEAEMITLDLADELDFAEGDSFEVVAGAGAEERADGIPRGQDNLVRRALAAAGRRAAVRLYKHIPTGAGLGGGSADAAAVLRWAGVTDLKVAARLGADVPFCVVGGRAMVRGVGEQITPLPWADVDRSVYTLLTPPLPVPTAAVYQEWDRLGGPIGEHGNDLEPAALSLLPELSRWRDRLGDATGLTPRLAGSGGTWFVPGEFPGEGRIVVRAAAPS